MKKLRPRIPCSVEVRDLNTDDIRFHNRVDFFWGGLRIGDGVFCCSGIGMMVSLFQ